MMWRVPEVLPASMVPEGVHHVVGVGSISQ